MGSDPAVQSSEDEEAIARYRARYGEGPFLAADAVVRSSDGCILLIRRSKAPGRGLLALPGGFVERDETFLETAVRELGEETAIHVAGSHAIRFLAELKPRKEAIFDAPNRDPRARIVSVAFYFRLAHAAHALPVKAMSDAAAAEWVTIKGEMTAGLFFADHFRILRHFGLVPVPGKGLQSG